MDAYSRTTTVVSTEGDTPRRDGIVTLLIAAGATAVLLSLVADYLLGNSTVGFGGNQRLLLAAGSLSILSGIALEIASGRQTAADVLKFWIVAAQVGLLAYVMDLYNFENTALYRFVLPLLLCGFIINHYLQTRFRPPFFLVLSLAGIAGVLGPASLSAVLWLVGLGLGLIGICHLPIPVWGRVAALVACGGLLALVRLGRVDAGGLAVALPILASMFMFRIAIYLYDTENKKGPADLSSRVSYFFMLPNVVFPFFPVIDYATFGRTYYNENSIQIYQRGATWILRGILHLLLFRVVNYYFVIGAEDVSGPASFIHFVVANFCLYLRVSGLFHLIIGFLLLFGFNLPETHSRYFLSSSFMDFWRRINIYWKDFMQKLVFNPAYMALKGRGVTHLASIIIAMFAVFFCTWILHAYQWFWLRGTVLLSAQDMMFWGILAVFLAIQTLRESNAPPPGRRTVSHSYRPWAVVALRAVRIACTFLTICILWSLWTSESLSAWLDLWRASGLVPALDRMSDPTIADLTLSMGVIAIVCVMAAVAAGFGFRTAPPDGGRQASLRRSALQPKEVAIVGPAVAVTGICATLLLSQAPAVTAMLGSSARQVAEDIRNTRLNARDRALLERGYYQQLTNIGGMNSPLWEVLMNQRVPTMDFDRFARRDDYLKYENQPLSSYSHAGVPIHINRWGMRDQDYELKKPPGTYRIAIIEASRGAGWGVQVEDRFDSIIETRLNGDNGVGASQRFEILNFSVDGYVPSQRLLALDWKAGPFQPDAAIYIAGFRDFEVDHDAEMLFRGIRSAYQSLNDAVDKSGAHSGMSISQIERLLRPHWAEILTAVYTEFVSVSRRYGAEPIWVYLPDNWGLLSGSEMPNWLLKLEQRATQMKEIARKAGFTIVDLSHVFDGKDATALQVSSQDSHPNREAHRIIAEALEEKLHNLKTWPH